MGSRTDITDSLAVIMTHMNALIWILVVAILVTITESASIREELVETDRTQGISCFNACSAANFASTTQCTFGFIFTYTTTCNQVFPVLSIYAGITSLFGGSLVRVRETSN